MSKVWLVTGSGSGLGRAITIKALEAGHRVVATARDLSQLNDLVASYGPRVKPVRLDVTDEQEAAAAVEAAISAFGGLDVLVNNAGFGETRPFEEVSSDDFRRVVETNFFGVVNLTRAALPGMRQRRSGHIIQISSVGGRSALAGNAAYVAAKWAVGGFAETVALEAAPFGVKVTALEPGGMRTNWGKRAFGNVPSMLPDYDASIGETVRQLAAYWGNEPGDPEKIAQVVVRVAQADRLPPHILLGSDALQVALGADAVRSAATERWKAVSAWTDVASEGPLPDFPSE
ncbi:SDR family NAD(P)-dependent oxidoreductase [Shinella sp. CPCC 101442]|uniref:SDR family NAD(P)-dependent oxidoreductase n=1 Tax=Shinella sp. CPCC 101442 TaxID=2932265 RepID=UPI0021531828|nr:SDR family NAD(P)-dependent oxidoreductase [Shinella sp. CPCC 101442]MCR6502945.1 SDR family NAD(P)-dependent oxidoreductase [Shinella sp. CPCC 101442]